MQVVDGIILAGGSSKRMRQNKMQLPFHGHPIIHHTMSAMASVCAHIVIVTGQYQDNYAKDWTGTADVDMVHNPDHAEGMFTSVQCGARTIQNDVFLIPGDCPLVEPSTYETLLQADGPIRVPTYHGRRGHPIFLAKELLASLRQEPSDSNLKAFRDRHEVTYVEVDDPHILFDVDDMLEYQKLLDMERMD